MTSARASSLERLAKLNAIRVGDTASCGVTITQSHIDTFVQLTADDNPLHLDPPTARAYGFERPVAHGMLALGAISRLIGTQLPGPGSLWVSQDVKFVAPVLVGDALTATVRVEQISTAAGLVLLKTEVSNAQTGACVLTGTARVKVMSVMHSEGAAFHS
jgi:acyl dehydratase